MMQQNCFKRVLLHIYLLIVKDNSMLKRFAIYGALGWIMEILWTAVWSGMQGDWKLRGHTYLWMFPIYGMAVFLEPIHDYLRKLPVFLRGLLWMAFIYAIEYTTGWLLDLMLGVCPWDYSASPLSVDGYIRLDYAPAWMIAGLAFEKIHDFLDQFLGRYKIL